MCSGVTQLSFGQTVTLPASAAAAAPSPPRLAALADEGPGPGQGPKRPPKHLEATSEPVDPAPVGADDPADPADPGEEGKHQQKQKQGGEGQAAGRDPASAPRPVLSWRELTRALAELCSFLRQLSAGDARLTVQVRAAELTQVCYALSRRPGASARRPTGGCWRAALAARAA